MREGKDKTGLIGLELEGKKFGIIGMGAIGTRTAQLAAAFGCQVYGYNRSPKSPDGVIMTDMETLLKECDIVSLHVPLTEQTKGLIGEEQLRLMKPGAVLINTARGPWWTAMRWQQPWRKAGLRELRWMCLKPSRPSAGASPFTGTQPAGYASCGFCHEGSSL